MAQNSNLQSGFSGLTPTDLKDPNLIRLNQILQQLTSRAAASQATFSSDAVGSGVAWVDYTPPVVGLAGLAVTGVTTENASYKTTDNNDTHLTVDINMLVTNTGPTLSIGVPVPPTSLASGAAFACVIYQSGGVVAGTANLLGGVIIVNRYDHGNIPTGGLEVVVSGFYRS
jgi:hypothetical protein